MSLWSSIGDIGKSVVNSVNPFSSNNIFSGSLGSIFPTMNPTVQKAAGIGGAGLLFGGLGAGAAGGGASPDLAGMTMNDILGGSGAAAGGGTAAGGAGGGLLGTINGFLKGNAPLIGTGLNLLQMTQLSNAYKNLAGQASNYSSLDQAQRKPYQANLSELINNPQQYLTNDPFASSLTALYRDKVIPRNVAQSGNPASVIDTQGSNFINALAGNYNAQVGNLSGIAGFGFPQSFYAGSNAAQLGAGGANANAGRIASLGNIFGTNMGGMRPQGTSGTGLFGTVS